MNKFLVVVTVQAILAFANGNVAYTKTANHLHPVHGLFVKPSIDGTTGDLYVAATEDNGAKTQWLTDHPIHFLPMQSQPVLPTGYNLEDLNPHKRAVVNPPVQYTYALPATSNSEAGHLPYPYAMPTAGSPYPAVVETKTEAPAPVPVAPAAVAPSAVAQAAVVPQYNPYQFFYPQMLTAYANMMSILKDAGLNEETATSVVSQSSPMWSQSYAYPYQYVMVDPNAWAQAQAQATAAPPTTSTPASPVEAAADKE